MTPTISTKKRTTNKGAPAPVYRNTPWNELFRKTLLVARNLIYYLQRRVFSFLARAFAFVACLRRRIDITAAAAQSQTIFLLLKMNFSPFTVAPCIDINRVREPFGTRINEQSRTTWTVNSSRTHGRGEICVCMFSCSLFSVHVQRTKMRK